MQINFKSRATRPKIVVLTLLLTLSAVISLSIGARANFADRVMAIVSPPVRPSAPSSATQSAIAAGQSQSDARARVNLQTLVTPGLQVAAKGAWADKNSGRQTITLNALNVGSDKLEEVEVVLVDMTPAATISKIESHRLPLNVSDRNGTISFISVLPHRPAHTQMVAVMGVGSETRKQEIEVRELIASLMAVKSRGQSPALTVTERAKEQTSFRPDVCYESFRLAGELASDLGLKATGNLCNRYRGSFAISFTSTAQQ